MNIAFKFFVLYKITCWLFQSATFIFGVFLFLLTNSNDCFTVIIRNDQGLSLNKIFHIDLNCSATLPDKNCGISINIFLYIFTKIQSIWARHSHETS